MNTEYAALLILFHTVFGQRSFLQEIERSFEHQGIPFREENYLFTSPVLTEYDFIIVGSGPAGSTIANRLSEVPLWKVLLIEKGPEGNIIQDIPFINPYTVLGRNSVIYDVEKEKSVCWGLVGRRCHWPSGNGVGGATLINGLVYTRGHPQDFDDWALQGNPGWSYAEVLPYFLKSENMTVAHLADSQYHSTQGPLPIDYPFISKLGKRFLKAGQELGYSVVDYHNPNTMIGFATSQIIASRGRRVSAASAFLLPIKHRKNLHIVKNALVTKILISENNRAYGVKFLKNGKEREVLARMEVILSAGGFGSPQLLMLSGIGPKNHLRQMNIPVHSNLPVGKNLQDHVGTPAVMFLINSTDSYNVRKMILSTTVDFIQWYAGVKNIYANNGGEALAYMTTKYAESEERPDIELLLSPTTITGDGGLLLRRALTISSDVYFKTWGNLNIVEAFSIGPVVMNPKSRGEVTLKSRNPKDPLSIRSNFFTDPYDMKVLIEGVRAALRVAETKTFQEIGARLYPVPISGCEHFQFNSDDYWDCAIRTVPVWFRHQSGTCKMGPSTQASVVDHRLKVYGIEKLRVADASIMPTIPTSHIMAACYMIGEKAADLIKEDWGVI